MVQILGEWSCTMYRIVLTNRGLEKARRIYNFTPDSGILGNIETYACSIGVQAAENSIGYAILQPTAVGLSQVAAAGALGLTIGAPVSYCIYYTACTSSTELDFVEDAGCKWPSQLQTKICCAGPTPSVTGLITLSACSAGMGAAYTLLGATILGSVPTQAAIVQTAAAAAVGGAILSSSLYICCYWGTVNFCIDDFYGAFDDSRPKIYFCPPTEDYTLEPCVECKCPQCDITCPNPAAPGDFLPTFRFRRGAPQAETMQRDDAPTRAAPAAPDVPDVPDVPVADTVDVNTMRQIVREYDSKHEPTTSAASAPPPPVLATS